VKELSEATRGNNVDLIGREESCSHTRSCFRPGAHCFLTGMQSRNGNTEHVFIPEMDSRLIGCFPWYVRKLLTPVYNCAQKKFTDPRDGCSLREMPFNISAGASHDQEQDSEHDYVE